MKRLSYPSDLTEKEWAILEPLIPPAKPGGHPRTTDIREVINAILYLDRTGSQWRALPHEFPRLYHGVELLPHLAQHGDLEAHAHRLTPMGAPETRAPAHSQRGHHRQSIGEDDTTVRGSWLRWRQKSHPRPLHTTQPLTHAQW